MYPKAACSGGSSRVGSEGWPQLAAPSCHANIMGSWSGDTPPALRKLPHTCLCATYDLPLAWTQVTRHQAATVPQRASTRSAPMSTIPTAAGRVLARLWISSAVELTHATRGQRTRSSRCARQTAQHQVRRTVASIRRSTASSLARYSSAGWPTLPPTRTTATCSTAVSMASVCTVRASVTRGGTRRRMHATFARRATSRSIAPATHQYAPSARQAAMSRWPSMVTAFATATVTMQSADGTVEIAWARRRSAGASIQCATMRGWETGCAISIAIPPRAASTGVIARERTLVRWHFAPEHAVTLTWASGIRCAPAYAETVSSTPRSGVTTETQPISMAARRLVPSSRAIDAKKMWEAVRLARRLPRSHPHRHSRRAVRQRRRCHRRRASQRKPGSVPWMATQSSPYLRARATVIRTRIALPALFASSAILAQCLGATAPPHVMIVEMR